MEVTEFTGALCVRSTADFLGILPHCVDFDFFAVLAFEQTDCALFLCFFHGHLFAGDRNVCGNCFIDKLFNFRKLFRRHFPTETEVEAEPLSRNIAAFLRDGVIVQNLPQRCMHQMRCGVQRSSCFAVIGKSAFEALFCASLRLFLMLFKRGAEPCDIHRVPLLVGKFNGKLDRESVGIVQMERVDAIDLLTFERLGQLAEFADAFFQRIREAIFFFAQFGNNLFVIVLQFRVEVTVDFNDLLGDGAERVTRE